MLKSKRRFKTRLLHEIRMQEGLSLREVAKRAGLSHNTIHLLETGQQVARPETVMRIAKALGRSVYDVVYPDLKTMPEEELDELRDWLDELDMALMFMPNDMLVTHAANVRAEVHMRRLERVKSPNPSRVPKVRTETEQVSA